jgi:hypothetical protein
MVRGDIRLLHARTMGEDPSSSVFLLHFLTGLLLLNSHDLETVAIFSCVFALFLVGLFKYLPEHVLIMQRRLMYYLWGQEGDERFLWQRFGARQGVGLLKEL